MNTSPIIVVGTPQGFWTQWVRQTLSRLEHAQVHADLPSSEALGVALAERPESKALVLVEHPATGLARQLADGAAIDPGAWLDEWLASGRALLAHAQRHPSECLLLNADDARCRPDALAVLLRSRWSESFVPSAEIAPGCAPDPLATALAWSFVDRSPALQDVAEELLASCVVLPGDESRAASFALVPKGPTDGAAATARLARLLDAERRLDRELREFRREREESRLAAERLEGFVRARTVERDEAETRAARTERELADARTQLDAAERERETLVTRLDDAVTRQAVLVQDIAEMRARGDGLAARLDSRQEALDAMRAERDAGSRRLDALRTELAAAQSDRDAERQRVVVAQAALTSAQQRVTTTERQLKDSREESDLLLQQLHEVQEELEKTLLARSDAEAAFASAAAERDSLTQRIESLRRELDAARQELGVAAKSLESTKAEQGAAKKSLDDALVDAQQRLAMMERELKDAKEEGELLLAQLHHVQEELEKMFFAKRGAESALCAAKAGPDPVRLEAQLSAARDECELLTLQTNQVQLELVRVHEEKVRLEREAKARILLPGLDGVSIGEVRVVGERDTPPHREVSFAVRDVRAGSRHISEATVRLVEHWGRPGLAVFADESGSSLFEAWRECGREDGRPYMLLVHGEEPTQQLLDTMGTFDWQLIQALAARFRQSFDAPETDVSPVWRSLAQRLLTSLQEQPARLRHEDVRVMPIAQSSPEVARWGLVLEHASYRGRTWPRFTLQWRASGPHPSIELVRDEESGPPLVTWPAGEDGLPVRALRLPIGDDPYAPEVRAAWDLLIGADKAFVAEVLNLLPILAVHVQASMADTAPAVGAGVDLQAAARTSVQFGRAALQPSPQASEHPGTGRRLMHRIARRLRRSAAPAVIAADTAR